MKRLIIAGVFGLALVGCSGTTGTGSNGDAVVDMSSDACIDKEAGIAASNLMGQALMGGQADLKRYDLQGAAQELHNAAGYARDASAATAEDAAVSAPMARAADLFDSAATKLASVSSISDVDLIDSSTQDMIRASELIDDSTAALGNTDLEPC